MFVIRPVKAGEEEILERMVKNVSLGITSLPRKKDSIQKQINHSIKSFAEKDLAHPIDERYLFALENLKTNEIIGLAGIHSKTGIDEPHYFYRIESIEIESNLLPLSADIKILTPIQCIHGPSEIGSLFLKSDYRKEGLGRLLSLSRFLFIASFLHRFDTTTFALMRAFHDKEQRFPFWEGIGRHFIAMEYGRFIEIREIKDAFVQDVLAKYPVFVSLLTKETQEAIGKVHPNTQPALTMLMKEGFQLTDKIDLFDGGPKIEAKTSEIRTVKNSRTAKVTEITEEKINTPYYLISNQSLDFRACQSTLYINENDEATLDKETAEAINIQTGDFVRYIPKSENMP